MPRICLASEHFFPVYAGPAVRFGRYLPGLRARGIDVRVFTGTPYRGRASRADDGSAGPEPLHGTSITRVRLPEAAGARRRLLFARALARFCGTADPALDAVQLLSCDFTFIPALMRLQRLGIPTIYTLTLAPDERHRGLRRLVSRHYFAQPLRLVSCVVVSSRVMRDGLRNWPFRTPVRVIPNGVDTRRFQPAADDASRRLLRKRLGLPDDETIVLFVGPLSRRKGVDLLLGAWSRLAPRCPDLHLVVVGPGPDGSGGEAPTLGEAIRRLGVGTDASERLHFPGLVENVEDYMRAADVFVFTSRREGMPNVVPEAMATGLPVVTTPFLGLPSEFGQPDREYLLADFDPDALAARVQALLVSPEQARALGRSARRWVEEHLDMDRSIDRYAELYHELAHPAGAPRR